jgi:hypothetical protein
MATSFLYYAFHYVILRTLYDSARVVGVSPWLLVVIAVVGLLLVRLAKRKRYRW